MRVVVSRAGLALFLIFSLQLWPCVLSACTLKTHTPSGASCGIHGELYSNISNPSILLSYASRVSAAVTGSSEECALLCFRRGIGPGFIGDCTSFFFDSTSGECQLSQRYAVAESVNPKASSPTVFYDRACHNCGPVCDQALGANLLDNGDFEETLLGPWLSNNGGIGPGNAGGRAWITHIRPDQGLQSILQQGFNVCGKRDYTYGVRFDYRVTPKHNISATSISLLFGLGPDSSLYGEGGLRYWSFNPPPTADGASVPWTRVYGFVPWNYLNGFPFLFNPSAVNATAAAVDVSMDNIAVFRVPSNPATKPSTEAISNGGFETGSFAPWTVSDLQSGNETNANLTIISPGIAGNYALRFNDTKSLYNSPALSQILSLKPSTPYMFSCNIRVSIGAPNLRFAFGPTMAYFLWLYEGPGSYTYQVPVLLAESNVNLVLQTVYNDTRYSGPNTDFIIDNISLREFRDQLKEP